MKSTLAAECLAAVECAEMTIYVAALVNNILQSSQKIRTYVLCDNRNLVTAAYSSTNLEDRRLVIDVSILRDLIQRQELTGFLWVPTDHQLANTLTKQGASDKLLLDVFNHNLRFRLESFEFE